MRYKSRTVHLQHQYVVHHPNLSALHKLHLSLMSVRVHREADATALVDMPSLGEKLDVKRGPLHLACRLRMHITSYQLTRPGVYPLPSLAKAAQFCVALSVCSHDGLDV